METRKGPYGAFAVQIIDDENRIYNYAGEVIKGGIFPFLLIAYEDSRYGSKEISYDCSGLIPLSEISSVHETDEEERIRRRHLAGDLFCFIAAMPDLLLPLRNINTDPHYVYEDNYNQSIRFCYLPCFINGDDDDASGLMKLIDSPWFSGVIGNDERQSLTYALSRFDMGLLERIGKSMMSSGNTSGRRDTGLSGNAVMISSIFALLSVFLLITGSMITMTAAVISSVFFLIRALGLKTLFPVKAVSDVSGEGDLDLRSERRAILFDEEEDNVINGLFLESVRPVGDDIMRRAVYTVEATVGSDCFLSDILIDDPSIEPLHARILKNDRTYLIEDLSKSRNTYINNIPVSGRTEIKQGQEIRFGDVGFVISMI